MKSEAPRLNVLIAYPYCSPDAVAILRKHRGEVRLLLDSGAFTAWKAGKSVELDAYCKFIEALPVPPWKYFMLDVIGDPAATARNYETMLRRGFDPIPIFTRGESPAMLDQYFKTSDVVGIGGLVRTQRNRAFVNGIMRHVGTRNVHLLGFSDIVFLKQYRPFSCDSSGWDQSKYGKLRMYLGNGRFAYVGAERSAAVHSRTLAERFRFYGVDPSSLRDEVRLWHGEDRRERPATLVNRRSMVHAARDMEVHLGTKYFFATGMDNLPGLIEAWERLK